MNVIELHEALRGKKAWTEFAEKLKTAMTEEYRLDGVTVILREMTAAEAQEGEDELLTFNLEAQRFDFALAPGAKLPAGWKVADQIDYFLNPDGGGDG